MTYDYIPSKKDLRNYKINKESKVEIPGSFSLGSYTILNQGHVGSCVAHATCTLLESIYYEVFSPGWIYGNRNYFNYSRGMSIQDALKTAKKYGGVKRVDFDVNEEVPLIFDLVNKERDKLIKLAESYKIGSYAELKSTEDIKIALLKGLPVIFSTCVKEDELSMNDDYVINVTNDRPKGGHIMVIYGWNDTGWLIQNSWGKSWGNKGTAILPYNYKIDEAFAVSKYSVDETNDIVKPKWYWLRELISFLIKIFEKWKGK